jgi:hypothetical protein
VPLRRLAATRIRSVPREAIAFEVPPTGATTRPTAASVLPRTSRNVSRSAAVLTVRFVAAGVSEDGPTCEDSWRPIRS